MHQAAFDFKEPEEPGKRRKLTIAERFEVWIQARPDVWETYCRMARSLKARGFKHYSSKSLFEAMRFHAVLTSGPDGEGFRVNNNYSSRMSRRLCEIHPEFNGFFEFRELKSD